MLKKINTLFMYRLIFILACYAPLAISNLFYTTTIGPDFNRYKLYLLYFFGEETAFIPEQGFAYFLIIAFFCKLQISDYQENFSSLINNVGIQDNFNVAYLSDFEYKLNLGIQYGNYLIFLFGLFGIFQLLKNRGVESKDIYKILTIVIFIPVCFQIRLTMKPEIFAFALLPFAILYFEKLIIYKQKIYVIYLAIISALLVTTKASIAGMVVILFFTLYLKERKKIAVSKVFLFCILSITFTVVISYENYKINNYSIFEREELAIYFEQEEYDNRATPEIFYTINFTDLIKNPNKNFHNNSIIGITLLDTFGDYFNEYWNKDYTFFKENRKEFVQKGNQFNFDLNNKIVTIPINVFNLNKLRSVFGLLLSVMLYFLIIKSYIKKDKDYQYIIMPFAGILVLIINSLGFPENNFNPETGDTFKSYYYSFFLIISIIFILKNYIAKSSLTFPKILLAVLLSFFIIGFPKANNTNFDYQLYNLNSMTIGCSVNKVVIDQVAIDKFDVDCKKNKEPVKSQVEIKNYPKLNLVFLILTIFLVIYDTIKKRSKKISNTFQGI